MATKWSETPMKMSRNLLKKKERKLIVVTLEEFNDRG